MDQLDKLQAEMLRFYKQRRNKVNLQQDRYFAALHSDDQWYRVRINSFLDESTVTARFVDYGDVSMINSDNLDVLWPQFRNLPMQAINASMSGK